MAFELHYVCDLTFTPASKSTGDKAVQAKAIPMDFSKLDDAAQWQKFQSEIAGLDIGVLGEYMLGRMS